MAEVQVTFSVTSGSGSISGNSVATNASGVATVGGWTLGTVAGSHSIAASTSGLTSITFTAAAAAGAAASTTKTAGDGQFATAGSAVSTAPTVTVRDANGNPVSGVNVVFAVASGGGSVTGAAQTTNSAGLATLGGWTLGTTAGVNTLAATAGSLPALTFTASGGAGPVASLTKIAGDNQTTLAGTSVAVAPSVTVKDANGNVVSGVLVTFSVASGGGSVTGANYYSNGYDDLPGEPGNANVGSWTLGSTPGTNTLTASTPGASAVTFTATATAPVP